MRKIYTLILASMLCWAAGVNAQVTSVTIYDIQYVTDPGVSDVSAYDGDTVSTEGVVTATGSSGYWIQSGDSSWSGIYVYDYTNTPAVGDSISVTAVVDEYFGLTELTSVQSFAVNSSGNSVSAVNVTAADAGTENYEGVYVQLCNATCVDTVCAEDTLLNKHFENADSILTNGGWTTFDALGAQNWYVTDYNGDHFANMNGYSGGSNANEDWLISPPVTTTGLSDVFFSFYSASKFTGNAIEVYISTDYDGSSDPTTGFTWDTLSPTLDLNTATYDWTHSGDIDISAYQDDSVFIAFKYTSDASNSARWEIDDIRVLVGACTLQPGQWKVNDGTADLLADDKLYSYQPMLNDTYNVRGVMNYDFSERRLEPTGASDIVTPVMSLSTSTTKSSCGASDGTATVTPSNGTTGYSYMWDAAAGSQTDSTATGLVANSYSVTVTDGGNCTASASVTVKNLSGPQLSFDSTNVVCNGDSTGSAEVIVTSGSTPYSYQWVTGDTDSVVTGLAAGSYGVTVTDSAGCVVSAAVTINENTAIAINGTVTDESTTGSADGSIELNVTGGVSPYTYLWDDASTDSTLTGLTAGTYAITVTDDSSCMDSTSFTVGTSSALTTIYDIQYVSDPSVNDSSTYFGQTVTTSGIVTAIKSGSGYWLQDGDSAWSGVYVYDNTNTPSLGDEVQITAEVDEFRLSFDSSPMTLTELVNVSGYSVLSTGNTYNSVSVSTGGVNAEAYEGVLVQVTNATCFVDTNQYGEWKVDDGSGLVMIDDALYTYGPTVGTIYNVTGVVSYGFNAFKMLPRDINDIDSVGTNPNTTPEVSIYNIQYAPGGPSPYDGVEVITQGIVTAVVTSSTSSSGGPGYWIQDGDSAWSGVFVHDTVNVPSMGDSVKVTATVDEFYSLTELTDVSSYTVLSTGNTVPSGVVVSTADANAEKYEGVLIQVVNATCTDDNAGFGTWKLHDGSDTATVDDEIYGFTPILGGVYTVQGVTQYTFGEMKIFPRMASDIGQTATIYMIQSTHTGGASDYDGQSVTTGGIVTATASGGYYMQSGTGDYSGIYVFDGTNSPSEGDSVVVTGTVDEYFSYTEITNVSSYNVVSSGNTLPAVTVLTTTNVNQEQYEGVLVQVDSAAVDAYDSSTGKWTIDDGSGDTYVDDNMYAETPIGGNWYRVAGVVHYTFSEYRIMPRDANDVEMLTPVGIDEVDNMNVEVYPNPATDAFVIRINNAEENTLLKLYDLKGAVVMNKNIINGQDRLDVSELPKGVYVIELQNGSELHKERLIVH